MVRDFEKMIYGVSSDIICTLVNSLATSLHSEFRALTRPGPSDALDKEHEWSLTLIVELVNKSTNKLERTVVFSFGEDLPSNLYEQF